MICQQDYNDTMKMYYILKDKGIIFQTWEDQYLFEIMPRKDAQTLGRKYRIYTVSQLCSCAEIFIDNFPSSILPHVKAILAENSKWNSPQQSCGVSARDSLRSSLVCCAAELRGIRPWEIKSNLKRTGGYGLAHVLSFTIWQSRRLWRLETAEKDAVNLKMVTAFCTMTEYPVIIIRIQAVMWKCKSIVCALWTGNVLLLGAQIPIKVTTLEDHQQEELEYFKRCAFFTGGFTFKLAAVFTDPTAE